MVGTKQRTVLENTVGRLSFDNAHELSHCVESGIVKSISEKPHPRIATNLTSNEYSYSDSGDSMMIDEDSFAVLANQYQPEKNDDDDFLPNEVGFSENVENVENVVFDLKRDSLNPVLPKESRETNGLETTTIATGHTEYTTDCQQEQINETNHLVMNENITQGGKQYDQRNDTDEEIQIQTNNSIGPTAVPPWSLEAKRRAKARNYDPGDLDGILGLNSLESTESTNIERIVKQDFFRNFDPRIKYKEDKYDLAWLERKKEEIVKRGGRKGQYGKILTPEMIRERLANGWHKYQTMPYPKKQTTKDDIRFLRDFWDLPEELEPIVHKGKLYMADATENNARGRKKRNAARKMWPVET